MLNTNKLFNYIFTVMLVFCQLQLTGCASFTDEKGFGVNYDRRTAGTALDDKGLDLRANSVLTKDKEIFRNCNIKAIGYNGAILLVGQAPTDELKQRATELLTHFVREPQIYNQITVEDPIPVAMRANDTWITTQVKGKIMANKKIGINRVKVVTENGVVFLLGIVTPEEAELAANLASETKYVKQVVKIFSDHQTYQR